MLWWCIAEYMIHVMYMHSIQSNETYLEILPPWALGKSLYGLYFSTFVLGSITLSFSFHVSLLLQTHSEHVFVMQNLKTCFPHRS